MITNSFKHAFKSVDKAIIKIDLKDNGSNYELNYHDNGGLLNEKVFLTKRNSKGLDLIETFSMQLDGIIKVVKEEEWVGYQLSFPKA